MASPQESKLQFFLRWLGVNGVELRGCKIKICHSNKGFGIFSADNVPDGKLPLMTSFGKILSSTREQNIPLPQSHAFPEVQQKQDNNISSISTENDPSSNPVLKPEKSRSDSEAAGVVSAKQQGDTIWAEGLVPGIDFCNHDLKAQATWDVDGTGLVTGVPFSMYHLSAGQNSFQRETEISISYRNKGNEFKYAAGAAISEILEEHN